MQGIRAPADGLEDEVLGAFTSDDRIKKVKTIEDLLTNGGVRDYEEGAHGLYGEYSFALSETDKGNRLFLLKHGKNYSREIVAMFKLDAPGNVMMRPNREKSWRLLDVVSTPGGRRRHRRMTKKSKRRSRKTRRRV